MTAPLALRVVVAADAVDYKKGARLCRGLCRKVVHRFAQGATALRAEGGGLPLRAMSFIMPPPAVTSTSSIIIRITTVHPFATSWPSSPKGDARTLRDWLSVSYVTQYPVPPIFSFPLEGKCLEEARGCTGQSTDRMLHRGPDRQSAAP